MDSLDDLLDRAVKGDGEAVATLLEQHAPRVRDVLAGRIPARWQTMLSVDDVMQETYIDAFLDIGRFEPRGEGAFTAWLTTLAQRNLLDALRMLEAEKRGRQFTRVRPSTGDGSLVDLYEQLGGTATTPSYHAARHEAQVRVRRAVEKLPEQYRTVIELYDLAGRPVSEVAERLERSPGAVFMLRARALRQLAEAMGGASQFLTGKR